MGVEVFYTEPWPRNFQPLDQWKKPKTAKTKGKKQTGDIEKCEQKSPLLYFETEEQLSKEVSSCSPIPKKTW